MADLDPGIKQKTITVLERCELESGALGIAGAARDLGNEIPQLELKLRASNASKNPLSIAEAGRAAMGKDAAGLRIPVLDLESLSHDLSVVDAGYDKFTSAVRAYTTGDLQANPAKSHKDACSAAVKDLVSDVASRLTEYDAEAARYVSKFRPEERARAISAASGSNLRADADALRRRVRD